MLSHLQQVFTAHKTGWASFGVSINLALAFQCLNCQQRADRMPFIRDYSQALRPSRAAEARICRTKRQKIDSYAWSGFRDLPSPNGLVRTCFDLGLITEALLVSKQCFIRAFRPPLQTIKVSAFTKSFCASAGCQNAAFYERGDVTSGSKERRWATYLE